MIKGIIIAVIVIAIVVALVVYLNKKSKQIEAQNDEARQKMDAVAQQVSMLIIDKKRMKIKDSGLSAQIQEALISGLPWYARGAKQCIVKAKVGPQMMTLLCEPTIFDDIPLKKEVKATVAGLLITKVKGIHGNASTATDTKKKKGLRAWALRKQKELNEERASAKK